MSKPAVSIVIPTYNRVELLGEALDSVHRQTFRDFEVIVVDDGSTEDVQKAAAQHPTNPLIIHQQRKGPGAARNRGIAAARATMVAFLDSDDLWHEEKLDQFVGALRTHRDVRIFYGPMAPIGVQGQPVSGRTKPCHCGHITKQLFRSSFVHVPTVVCYKDVLEQAGGFDESLPVCEDYDLWLRVSVAEPFGLVPRPLAWRRLHGDRLSKQCMSRNLAVKAGVLQRFYQSVGGDCCLDDGPARERLARVCFVAARAAFWNGEYQHALELCRASRQYGQSFLRTFPFVVGTATLGRFRRRPSREPSSPCRDPSASLL